MLLVKLDNYLFEYPKKMKNLELYTIRNNRIIGSYISGKAVYTITFDLNGITTSWHKRYFKRIFPINNIKG